MIPIDLAFRVETQLMDPVTNRPSYASRSKLIQSLLFDWLLRQGVIDPGSTGRPVAPQLPLTLDTLKKSE